MDFLDKQVKLPFSDRSISAKYAIIHMAYWLLITGFFIYEKKYLIYKASMPYFVACVSIRILLLIVIGYLNLHYFMPKFLLKKRYLSYFIAVIISVIGYLAIQSLFDFYMYGFVVGPLRNSNLMESLSYNFFSTLWYLGLMLALKLSLDWYEQSQTLQKIKIEKLQAEINYLRAQVNPHFLFNVLNSLYSLTIKKSDLAPGVVLKLSEMMEYMLYESEETFVPLERELKYLENYLELEKMRQGNHAEISLNIKGATERKQIAPFILLPIVENAFKHGVSKIVHNAWLHIFIEIKDDKLFFSIENSRLNFHEIEKHNGIGLSNLKQRLQLLYAGKHMLEITEDTNRFKLVLTIDL
jgi:two-component system LytT family sensor kinase